MRQTNGNISLEPTAKEPKALHGLPRLAPPADEPQPKIMIVDDDAINIKVARKYLQMAGYTRFVTVTEAAEALDLIAREDPDVVLLDVMMPNISGLDILEKVRASQEVHHIPVLILTASNDQETRQAALRLGATDFLTKPVDANELIARVRNALLLKAHHDHLRAYSELLERQVAERTMDLARARVEVVHCLGRAAEYRDNETGHHIVRVGCFARIIAVALGLADEHVELIELASPLHDVGKIGIPDAILLKPGRLDPEEYELMQHHCAIGKTVLQGLSEQESSLWKSHTELGARIIGDARSPLLKMASSIALTHHEKWDGSGYPLGLAGEDIPVESRITAAADVFDALSHRRPYKPPFPREKCFVIMAEERGKHFDPEVLDAFFEHSEEIIETQIAYAD